MHNRIQAHSAIFLANTIFGLGVPVTKLLLDQWVTPMGYMASRSLGACLVFWLISASLYIHRNYPFRRKRSSMLQYLSILQKNTLN